MYSFLEIEFIFRNCNNWEELAKACECLLVVMADGDLLSAHRLFISEQSNKRFRELENL
jgi:hypothetical protein